MDAFGFEVVDDAELASGSVIGLQAMGTIASKLATKDPLYLYCVMNSGLFQFVPNSGGGSAEGSVNANESEELRAFAVAAGIDPNVQFGSCRFACADPQYLSSSACCAAAAKMHNQCKLSASAQVYSNYTDILDSMIGLESECAPVSAASVVLWVLSGLLVVLLITLAIASRRLFRREAHLQDEEQIEAHAMKMSTADTHPRVGSLLLAWRQVSNLVWKNLQIKRTKPISFAMEIVLPLILTTGLVIIVNIDSIIGDNDNYDSHLAKSVSNYVESPASGFMCTDFNNDTSRFGVLSASKKAFYSNGQTVVGLFLLIVYIKFVSRTTYMMVIEKESRIREIMKIMGLSDRAVILSWMLTTATTAAPLAFAMAALLKYTNVFPHGSYITLVWLFFIFSMTITAFGYFMAPFFNKSRTAAIASVLAWIVLYFPYFAVQSKPNANKYAAALAPPTALGLAIDELLRHAQLGTGMAYDVSIARSPIKVPTAFSMCWMLVLDCVLLFALGWYVDQVVPQEYGVARRWDFLFTRSYWSQLKGTELNDDYAHFSTPTAAIKDNAEIAMNRESNAARAIVEPVSTALAAQERSGKCLQIARLRKVFTTDDSERIAVDDLTLTMYSGQITALLGHNGAGKTTTISMLTGLTPPTSGDATLYGRSIRRDFDELRHMMGICPQHDVLLGDLSVEDHLLFFGTMKNVAPDQLQIEVDKMIREVGLTEKRKVPSKSLSGGQKRKLSVALAFIGDSKLVFLDEPTSGMDPYSRRFTWNLLQRNRDDRVIVLTTHFMDEADILGDRIAIMADGQLCCAGTSLFLKNRFGAGYNLTLIKADSSCEVSVVTTFLRQFVPDAKCLSDHGSELVFQLPSDTVTSFPTMLETLDMEMVRLHVAQYGVSVTTLEEVFLRISSDREAAKSNGFSGTNAISHDSFECGRTSFGSQFAALLTKRFQITRRDRKSLINAVGIPVLLLFIALVISEIQVASFFPNYAESVPSKAMQASCNATSFTSTSDRFTDDYVSSCVRDYHFCTMGIFECDATVCCTRTNPVSPDYPCNGCNNAYRSCYNPTCMSGDGAKSQLTINSFLRATIVALAFSFIPAAIVAFIVREKNPIQNAKTLQLICGAKTAAYWFANWTHDAIIILLPVALAAIMIPVTSRGLKDITSDEVAAILLLLASHALVVIPMAYVVSHRYEKHSSAQTVLLVFGFFVGGALSIISFLRRVIDVSLTGSSGGLLLSTLDRSYLRWIYLLFPGYALNSGVYEITMHRVSHKSLLGASERVEPPTFFGLFPWLGSGDCSVECWDSASTNCCVRDVFALDVAGAPILYGLAEAVLFGVILFAVEKNSVKWKKESRATISYEDEDSDVAAERHRVQGVLPSERDAVFVRNLRQQYKGGKIALDDLCLAIPKGECFGYLGINGAGKSTTMKILTGQLAPTNGFASLGGYDLATSRDQARTVLGYCPQFDSLHDLLTVQEQLELYARLKGIPASQVGAAVDQKIHELGLEEYRHKLTRGLSGGNKRKVSTAIALLGAPRIIFLDEPSTGVDPSSRRKMWDVIAGVCAEKDSCVVLTTHSMEECEALATRVGILVSGRLQCLGSVEHLKQKFGKGYTVEVKLQEPSAAMVETLAEHVKGVVGDAGSVTLANLGEVCAVLGDPGRREEIEGGEASASVLTQLLRADGHVPVSTLCEWWAGEDLGAGLVDFFSSRLPGSEVVEQQGAAHFRFQVPRREGLRPSAIFRLLEEAKASLRVGEYSVSDTTLEHIFNTMAAQQEEEQLEVEGVAVVGVDGETRPLPRRRRVYRRASSSLPLI